MTPRITRQTKILLQQQETDNYVNKTSFSLAPDPAFNVSTLNFFKFEMLVSLKGLNKIFQQSSELGVWEETQSWEDQARQDWDVNEVIREKKRLDRERRYAEQQRKKIERDMRGVRHVVNTKIS